jgi:hypothetical protein
MKPIIIITTPVPMSTEQQEKLDIKALDSGSIIFLIHNPGKETSFTVIHDSSVTITKI